MNTKKISLKAYSLAKSALAGAILPVFVIYIMVDKPDYKIINSAAHIVIPAATAVGNVISWPFRAAGNSVSSVRSLSNLRAENEELRTRLDDALRTKNECDIAISENQKLGRELDIVRASPQKSVVANITQNNAAMYNNTFFLGKGMNAGIENGMAVVSFDGKLLGIVIDTADNFSKVRALTDSKSNVPVRIAGTQVYGFLQGDGSAHPSMEFFSDPEFQATRGLRLITSGIRGILPDGIAVGEMLDKSDADITNVSKISSVMVLKFDNKDKYK